MINKIYSFFFEKPYFSTQTQSGEYWEEAFDKAESGADRFERFFSMKNAELIIYQLINEYEDEYGGGFMFDRPWGEGDIRSNDVDIVQYGFRNFVGDFIVPAVAEREDVSEAQAAKKVREDLGSAYMNVVENIRRDANMEEMKERAPDVPADIRENAADIARAAKESENEVVDLDEVDPKDFANSSPEQPG